MFYQYFKNMFDVIDEINIYDKFNKQNIQNIDVLIQANNKIMQFIRNKNINFNSLNGGTLKDKLTEKHKVLIDSLTTLLDNMSKTQNTDEINHKIYLVRAVLAELVRYIDLLNSVIDETKLNELTNNLKEFDNVIEKFVGS